MIKLYITILIGTLCAVFYFYGMNVGQSKCQIQNIQSEIQTNQKIQQNKRIIHDTVYKTGVRDIRSILHNKYTIKE